MNWTSANHWPIWFICAAMIASALIDWWKYKVPNRLTFPIILSGWAFGLLHTLNLHIVPGDGIGGIGAALLGTAVGGLLLIVYAIGGVGGGDVKMSMGFGAWIGAYYGVAGNCVAIVLWALAAGMIVGGIIGLGMILVRRNYRENLEHTRMILTDVAVMMSTGNLSKPAENAQARRPRWHRLPYGVPLCIGFLGYLYVAEPQLPRAGQENRHHEEMSATQVAPDPTGTLPCRTFAATSTADSFVTTKRVEVVGVGKSKIKRVGQNRSGWPSNRHVDNEKADSSGRQQWLAADQEKNADKWLDSGMG